MNYPTRGRKARKRLMSDMNVVPYIDVMLVLLVIFMVTAPLITQGVKVDLPQVTSSVVPPQDIEPLIVTVDHDGNYYLNRGLEKEQDEPLSGDALIGRVSGVMDKQPGVQVMVKGDKNVAYARIVTLMALLQNAGVPGVGLMTEPVE